MYLKTRKTFDKPVNCNSENNCLIKLSSEERLCLINSKIFLRYSILLSKNLDLKIRYKDILTEYQHLPLHLETRSNIVKEKNLTNELINIEHDINFLEKYQEIFIIK
jgi:hypothetical protein